MKAIIKHKFTKNNITPKENNSFRKIYTTTATKPKLNGNMKPKKKKLKCV